MFLAVRPGRQTVAGIAEFFRISQTHIGKVVNQLARLGYVRSIRGIGGGLELARSPNEISIGEVVRAIEGNVHLLECISMDDVCIIQKHCKLRTVLDRAERIQFEYLNSVTLSDVLPFEPPQPVANPTEARGRTKLSPVKGGRSSTKRTKRNDGSAST
jgi:Rrf2 family nitric oxide-sensitive transcriptional repressor